MQILKLKQNSQSQIIKQASQVLQQGGLVIYPTETVYGAGVDATQQKAVNKLLAYKSRREGKPLSIAVSNQIMAQNYVQLNKQAQTIYQQFLPGPVTVISQNKGQVAKGVASEFNTLGIRIPDYPLILNLVKALNKPITSTSANASGKKRPYTIQDILDNLSQKQKLLIDLIIDAGKLPKREPSTVIDTTLSTPLTVRSGKLESQLTNKKPTANLTLTSHNELETQQIAGKLILKNWNQLKKQGLIIALNGPLGAGKTVFAKGAAKFLQIKQLITSPTYTYLKEYPFIRHQTQGMLYHLDAWRLDSQLEFDQLKIKELIKPNNLVLIEWWDQVASYFKPEFLQGKTIVVKIEVDQAKTLNLTTNRKLTIYQIQS